jgi:hypothetical protein
VFVEQRLRAVGWAYLRILAISYQFEFLSDAPIERPHAVVES